MKRRWKIAALCTALLMTVPMGCGMAEEGQASADTIVAESTPVTEDNASESVSAGEESAAMENTSADESVTAVPEGTSADESATGVPEGTETAPEADEGSMTAGTYTWHPETEEAAWNASDGKPAFTVSLEYPVFEGETAAEAAINAFYQEWAEKKMDFYESDPDSPVPGALEFWESDMTEDRAPWSDEYSVEVVTAVQGVISVRQDNYLFTGGAHGMPGRENHIFSGEDGSEVTLSDVLPLSEEEVNERAREAFLSRIEEHPEDGFFPDAADTVNAKTDFISQSYLTQDGVVFYAQPYELGPYAAGYIEVSLTWEQLGM